MPSFPQRADGHLTADVSHLSGRQGYGRARGQLSSFAQDRTRGKSGWFARTASPAAVSEVSTVQPYESAPTRPSFTLL